MKQLRLIYLVVALALLAGFATAGTTGFRVLSAFAGTAYVHGMAAGVHHK